MKVYYSNAIIVNVNMKKPQTVKICGLKNYNNSLLRLTNSFASSVVSVRDNSKAER